MHGVVRDEADTHLHIIINPGLYQYVRSKSDDLLLGNRDLWISSLMMKTGSRPSSDGRKRNF